MYTLAVVLVAIVSPFKLTKKYVFLFYIAPHAVQLTYHMLFPGTRTTNPSLRNKAMKKKKQKLNLDWNPRFCLLSRGPAKRSQFRNVQTNSTCVAFASHGVEVGGGVSYDNVSFSIVLFSFVLSSCQQQRQQQQKTKRSKTALDSSWGSQIP
jgi:hypothetical protein